MNRIKPETAMGVMGVINVLEALLWMGLISWSGTTAGLLLWICFPFLHVGFVYMFSYAVHRLLPRQPSLDLFSLGMGLFMPFTLPLLTVAYIFYYYEGPSREFVEEFEQAVFFDPTKGKVIPEQREKLREKLQVEPLEELLNAPNSELNRVAIEKLGNMKSEQAIKLLRQQVHHDDQTLRLHAEKELEDLSMEVYKELNQAKKMVEDSPESAEAHARLGRSYLKFAESGQFEGELKRKYLNMAKEQFFNARGYSDDENQYAFLLGKLSFMLEQYARALNHLEQARLRRPDDKNVLFYMARTCFRLRKFDRLQKIAGLLEEKELERTDLGIAIEHWAKSESPVTEVDVP